jgi:hypothetical protein
LYAPRDKNAIIYTINPNWKYNLDYECRQGGTVIPAELEKCINSLAKNRGLLYASEMHLVRENTGETIVVYFTSNATSNLVWRVVYNNDVNDIEGDALDAKSIAKDAISGAVTGVVSSVSSGAGQYLKSGNFGMTVAKNAQCGAMCGAFAGSATYMTDVAFGDKEFNGGELVKETVLNAGVSTISGAIVGAGNYGVQNGILKGATNAMHQGAGATSNGSNEIIKAIANDSATSTGKKVVSTLEKQILNI